MKQSRLDETVRLLVPKNRNFKGEFKMYTKCKVCDKTYRFHFLSQFPDEGYCPTCEHEIILCILEMEERDNDEEKEEEDETT